MQELAALGIKTMIDLREDPEAYEKPGREALGIRYVNIPMIDKNYPKPRSQGVFETRRRLLKPVSFMSLRRRTPSHRRHRRGLSLQSLRLEL